MKELLPHIIDPKEIHAVKPATKHKVIKKLFPMRGHRIFELNLQTGVINEVKPEVENVAIVPDIDIRTGRVDGGTTHKKGEIKQKEGCIYCTALNPKNADKHFHRLLGIKYKKTNHK